MPNIKKTIVTLALILVTSTSYAYQWTFSNFTSKPILVQVELKWSTAPYYVNVQPGKTANFDWPLGNPKAGFCLGAIKWLIPTKQLLSVSYIFNWGRVINNQKLEDFLAHFQNPPRAPYVKNTAHLRFLPDETYNKTVDAIKKAMGTQVGANIVGWFSDLIKESSCRSRDIIIAEDDKGHIGFYTLAN